jgi:hypothetical protein
MRTFKLITIRHERQFRAFTGLSEKEFDRLLSEFTKALESTRQQHYKKHLRQRQRKPGGGRKGALSTPELKLFFILFYLKTYPTFDVLGGFFDLSPAKAHENVVKLLPMLKRAEKNLRVLPHRHFKPTPDGQKNTDKKQQIIIDATERPCSRPHHARKQKHYYSGKKHQHTLKNTVIADGNQGIPVVGPTAPGSRHDYALLKEELNPEQPGLSSVEVSVDLGYQGIKDHYPNFNKICIPHKKPRKSKKNPNPTLTPKQKQENRALSRTRVAVEHLIGDLKIFHSLTIKFRNHIKSMADQVILLVAGLCNLKNEYVVQ